MGNLLLHACQCTDFPAPIKTRDKSLVALLRAHLRLTKPSLKGKFETDPQCLPCVDFAPRAAHVSLGANGGHTMVCPRLPLEHCRGQGLSRAQPRTVCPHRSLRAQLRTGSVRACRLGHSCGQASRLEYSRGQGLSAPVAERTAADRVCPHLSLMQHSCGQGLSAHVPWSTAASVRAGR
jgi:hypothetical protein